MRITFDQDCNFRRHTHWSSLDFGVHCRAMSSNKPSPLSIREALTFLFVASLTVVLVQICYCQMAEPERDARRYVDYALNIHEHGVFGLSSKQPGVAPTPGNANSPLYPALLAFAIWLDPNLERTLRCEIENDAAAGKICPKDYRTIVALQDILVVGALFSLWLTAMLLYQRPLIAWLTCALALATTKPLFFANNLLTEILVLFFFALLIFSIAAMTKSPKRYWWVVIGCVLGLLTLTRPEYLYLGYCGILCGVAVVFFRGWRHAGGCVLLFVIGFCIVVGPWLQRNHHHFDSFGITGGYSDVILAYRAAYNRMSLSEWAAAFVYWLPAHGEALATQLFPPAAYAKLGTDRASYRYIDGREIFKRGLAAVDGDRSRLTAYLIHSEILAHPIAHTFASVPLAWRGIFAGKYLAALGIPCFAMLLVIAYRRREWSVIAVTLPAAIMVGLYAAVSMSIPRYNVYLIYYYAIAVAWATVGLMDRLVRGARGDAR